MKEIINWLITSSADPKKRSLFVTSLATFAVLFGLDQTVVNQAQNDVANLIVGIGMVVSSATGIWGLVRKFVNGRWSAPQ